MSRRPACGYRVSEPDVKEIARDCFMVPALASRFQRAPERAASRTQAQAENPARRGPFRSSVKFATISGSMNMKNKKKHIPAAAAELNETRARFRLVVKSIVAAAGAPP